MANYKEIAKKHPAVTAYLRARIWARQGDLLTYRPNTQTRFFSIDSLGFRRSVFEGESFSVERSVPQDKYSVVLGSSHVFGFGLPGNEHTLSSRFAAKLGHPTLNVSFPEANTGDVCGAALGRFKPEKLDTVVLFPGGSFTRFCYTGICSPLDGPPTIHGRAEHRQMTGTADAPEMFENLLRYQKRSILRLARACSKQEIELAVVDEATFFEKSNPTEAEIEAKLGTSPQPQGQERFDRHRRYIGPYREQLFPALRAENIKILDVGPLHDIDFIDEFHYDSPSVQRIVDRLYEQMSAE